VLWPLDYATGHLNDEEGPEQRTYPRVPRSGRPRVLRSKESVRDDTTLDPRFGENVNQTIEDAGPP
jgi:hypothetical protein